MTDRLCTLTLARLLPLAAQAHRVWILPDATLLSGDDPWVTFDAAVSNDIFYTDHHPYALDRIEASSNDLSRLILDISKDARAQTQSAADLAGRIEVIQDIAGQTQVASDTTASAVSNLNALSVKLRESVAGFKLPSSEEFDEGAFDDTVIDASGVEDDSGDERNAA